MGEARPQESAAGCLVNGGSRRKRLEGSPWRTGRPGPEGSATLASAVQGCPWSTAPEAHSPATAEGGGAHKSKVGPVESGESPPLKPMKPPGLQWLWLFWGCSCSLGAAAAANSSHSSQISAPERIEKGSAAFQESLRRHHYLNSFSSSDNSSAIYGINQFSHLFPEEFRAIYLRSKPSELPLYNKELNMPSTHMPLPIRFDWRDKHVVTKVRNQQMCGGCWAFSVVGGIESAYAIKGESLEDLSVQQVIDCSYNNFGCSGGSTVNALKWLNKTQVRLVRDSEYSFKAQTGLCHYFSVSHAGVSIKGYSSYDFSDKEDEMARVLLAYGPLAVIVDAVSWQDYLGGIIQHHCSSGEANHAVLITGFDKTGNTPYWIVRNSWGTSWGVDGYAFVKMGANICGIADSVSAVFV
ncbi:cathepsin O isoform X2 [Petaurus breviceps papuanus]|uniref:cathepsin O isoform X2 n=1 Tax=Petaurus breviceps papuanus TaxID=3040969 RepID=UPI0036DC457B